MKKWGGNGEEEKEEGGGGEIYRISNYFEFEKENLVKIHRHEHKNKLLFNIPKEAHNVGF